MPDTTIDNRALLRQTLITMGAMVGACVFLVGTLALVASTAVARAVSPAGSESDTANPAASARPAQPGAVAAKTGPGPSPSPPKPH